MLTICTFTAAGSSSPLSGVGMSIPHDSFEVWATAVATASKKGPHAALASHTFARTPPVFVTSVVYVGPELGEKSRPNTCTSPRDRSPIPTRKCR